MIPLDTTLAFLGTSLLLAVIPGPDNLFVLSQSALRGARTGLFLTLGLCTGLVVYSILVAFGVAAIFQTSPTAFTALKAVGAAYLLYLAYGAFRAGPARIDDDGAVADDPWRAYRRGVAMNLTNPKIAVFFLAFLPQFTSPARGSVTVQLLVLGAGFILCSLLVFSGIALGAGALSGRLCGSARGQIMLHRVAGIVFVLLALKLLTTHQQ